MIELKGLPIVELYILSNAVTAIVHITAQTITQIYVVMCNISIYHDINLCHNCDIKILILHMMA